MMITDREANVVDVLVSGFTTFVGFIALNTAISLSRVRTPGGTLLTSGLIFKLVAFTVWTFEVFGASLYEYRERLSVSSFVQGMTNLDRLTLALPMAVLLVWVIPSVAHFPPIHANPDGSAKGMADNFDGDREMVEED
jgi:hypothetical protein